MFSYENMNELYKDVLKNLIENPDCVSKGSSGEELHELIYLTLQLRDPTKALLTLPKRKFSFRYLAGELAFYFSGSNKLAFIGEYSKFWKGISDNGVTVNSCYGKRIFREKTNGISQFDYAIRNLIRNPDSKNAIILFYDKRDTNLSTKDNCCTMYMQLLFRNGILFGKSFMRSNDIWFGLPYDLFFFSMLLNRAKHLLNSYYETQSTGRRIQETCLLHEAGSLHLYNKNIKAAQEIIQSETTHKTPSLDWTLETEDELPLYLYLEDAKRSGRITQINERVFSSPLWRLCALALNNKGGK